MACGRGRTGSGFILGEWCGFVNEGLGSFGRVRQRGEAQNPVQGSVDFSFLFKGERDMSSIAESLNKRSNAGWIVLAGMAAVIMVAIGLPNLRRSRMAVDQA